MKQARAEEGDPSSLAQFSFPYHSTFLFRVLGFQTRSDRSVPHTGMIYIAME